MTALLVLQRTSPVPTPRPSDPFHLVFGTPIVFVDGYPWDGARPGVSPVWAKKTRYRKTAIGRMREGGWPCPWCWIARGSRRSLYAHWLRFHRVELGQ